jgi:hypothetical protein
MISRCCAGRGFGQWRRSIGEREPIELWGSAWRRAMVAPSPTICAGVARARRAGGARRRASPGRRRGRSPRGRLSNGGSWGRRMTEWGGSSRCATPRRPLRRPRSPSPSEWRRSSSRTETFDCREGLITLRSETLSEPLRWGILSTGSIAHAFARDLQFADDGVVAAVGSRSQSCGRRVRRRVRRSSSLRVVPRVSARRGGGRGVRRDAPADAPRRRVARPGERQTGARGKVVSRRTAQRRETWSRSLARAICS